MNSGSPLPDYKSPPVDEVVCGILFESLKQFLVPHFGLLWQRFKNEYPTCRHVDPLLPVVETIAGPKPGEFAEIPLPRVWFLHDDGRIIQVQRDRFLHNWRKLKPTDEYPHYNTVFDMFQTHFSVFQEFLKEHQIGGVIPKQYEMTYVNIIPQNEGWSTVGEVQNVFPDFSWRRTKDRFLPEPAAINWQTSFDLPKSAGRLHMNIQSAARISDKRRVFRLEVTARGLGEFDSLEQMQDWFEMAHEWIVRGFADYTSAAIQKGVWERVR